MTTTPTTPTNYDDIGSLWYNNDGPKPVMNYKLMGYWNIGDKLS